MIRRRDTERGVRWDVIWREADRKQRSKTFRTKRDAQTFENELLRSKQLGAFSRDEPSRVSLSEYIDSWFAGHGPTWSPTTIVQRRSACTAWIVPMIGSVPLAELGPAKVRAWRADLAGRTTPGNANAVVAVLSAAMGAAVTDGMLPYNPCSGMRRLRVPKGNQSRTAWRQARRLLPYLERREDRLRAALMLIAGLRPSEASALTWGDVMDDHLVIGKTIQGGVIQPTKTGVVRICPIFDELHVELSRVKRRSDSDWVAPSPNGAPMNTHNYSRRVFAPAARRAHVDVTQYGLRHAAATWMLVDLGIPPVLVASYLGHSPAILLGTYADALTTGSHQTRSPAR
jgi:integrase